MGNGNSEQTNTLDLLLQVEAKAAALVQDAQEEADRRIRDTQEKASRDYEENIKKEIQDLEKSFKEYQVFIKSEYKNILDAYRNELSLIKPDTEKFCSLVNEYLDKG